MGYIVGVGRSSTNLISETIPYIARKIMLTLLCLYIMDYIYTMLLKTNIIQQMYKGKISSLV